MNVDFIRDFKTDLSYLDGASMLITGGTGSFGQHFIRYLLKHANLSRLVVFSRDEQKHFDMEQDFRDLDEKKILRYFIGDVRDIGRLEMALRGVDYIVHAAAMKHVSLAEYNPFECVHTNILGAENVVRAAIKSGVKHTIALSTDKAANPINLYGASKLASDKIFTAANNLSAATGQFFSVVRYGNVIGSRGSVVPLFQKLIKAKSDHLPITDMQMTRFWITLQQSVDFVLSSLKMMQGGEVFVPKIPSMRVPDLAEAMAPGLEQRVIGIRPGEKLHEIMIGRDDAIHTIEMDDRYIIAPSCAFWIQGEAPQYEGKTVSDRFEYTSDANEEWLDADTMRDFLAQS
ncbi:MAG: UDP-N-acetylglucosamine 4,6-dehydratase (inverting) [Magnetovibrio sp.]|nr:UDP-N-acetylglucosamine 4,6-dehydratase (inverting) [Magnetovibrio sp.]